MHFNFHLSGDETPEQSRRIANAVLALGGQLPASILNVTKIEDVDPEYLDGVMDRSEQIFGVQSAQLTEDDLPLNPPPYAEAEQFAGALSSDEVRAVESLPVPGVPTVAPPLPPIVAESPAPAPATDKNGLPWDERIHSGNRKLNADGTWRYRKNVPEADKRAVEAELRDVVYGAAVDKIAEVSAAGSQAVQGAILPPPVPLPSAPPVLVNTVQRSYSDVVNLIMANQATLNKPELYVAVLGMSLPEFAAACIAKPELATVAFNALDEIRRS